METTDPISLHLLHIPDDEKKQDGKRIGEVTRKNVTLEDVLNALLDLQVTEQIIESRNGTGQIRRYIFDTVVIKSKDTRAVMDLFCQRVADIHENWPLWYRR